MMQSKARKTYYYNFINNKKTIPVKQQGRDINA